MNAREAGSRRPSDASGAAADAPNWLAVGALCLLAVLGNYLRLPFFFGLDFLFGGIAVFLALDLYGFRAALVTGLVSGAFTYTIWNHPYAGIVFALEAVVVALLRRRGISLVLADAIFWLLPGAPLIWFFYSGPLNVDGTATLLVVLKDAVNGLFNALVATLVLQYSPLGRSLRRGAPHFREVVFNLLVAFVFLPSLLLLVLSGARDLTGVENRIRDRLEAERTHLVNAVRDWVQRRIYNSYGAGEIALGGNGQPTAAARAQLAAMVSAIPDLSGLIATDSSGLPLVSVPPLEAHGPDGAFRERVGRALTTGQPAVSGVLEDGGSPFVSVVVPIRRGSDLHGAMVARMQLDRLKAVIFTDTASYLQSLLTDSEGRLIASAGKALAPEVLTAGERADRGDGLSQYLPAGSNKPPINRWRDSVYVLQAPVGAGVPWTLSVRAAVAPFQAEVQRGQIRAFVLLLFLAALALALAALVSRAVTAPVSLLARTTRDLPQRVMGGAPVQWPQARASEVIALIGNFRSVTESLAANFRSLQATSAALAARGQQLAEANREVRELNTRLEARVSERTRELEERNAEQETFIYTVSHDLRTPLLSISGMSDLLEEAVRDGDTEQAEFLIRRVQANVGKMGDLLNDLLALSRAGRDTEEARTVELGAIVSEALGELEGYVRERKVRLDVAAGWPQVRYPPTEAYQVVSNLLSNALKWAGRGGEAIVRAHWQQADGLVTLSVEDNGPGVPTEYRERVFELFRKLHADAPGTGVGLAIVKRVVERHGGRVWVDDSPLGGAAFHAELPAGPAVLDAHDPPVESGRS